MYAMIFQSIGAFICGMAIAFYASWKMALIGIGLSPIVVFTSVMHGKIIKGV
jgi:ABC-type multidrug transport system fused ATPase/permease subunit